MNLDKYLKQISFNSLITNLEENYASLAPKLDLKQELNYKRKNESYAIKEGLVAANSFTPFFAGPFHFSLSVKVFKKSTFIPFKFIDFNESTDHYAPNVDKQKQVTDKVDQLVKDGVIKYNYADFLSEVSARFPVVSSVSFEVEKNEKGSIVIVNNAIKPFGIEQSELTDITINVKDFDKILLPDSFVVQFSQIYLDQIDNCNKLQFSLYAFDSDSEDSTTKLTHFIIITSNIEPSESQPFFYNYVRTIRDIASRIRTKHIQNLVQKTRFEAIKSAISAIMSRNMSHNLGSHYLYYTKAHLERISSDFLALGDKLGQFAPDVRGAAKVLGYVQGRMDYLATLISHDKYPYGSVNFKTHIWDELTIDDFSSRHFQEEEKKNLRTTNYLLTNLILSENFTRPDVRANNNCPPDGRYALLLNIKLQSQNNDNYYDRFTGLSTNPNYLNERKVKRSISQIYLALPGGIMSCHAFFNVVENFIRNSAKYLQSDFKNFSGIPGLIFTIAIRRNPKRHDCLDFIIYDNKENANHPLENGETLYNNILYNILGNLRIIDESGHIEKEAKGFKEMLFSTIWMRSYLFGKKTYADIITQINETPIMENLNVPEDEIDDSKLGKIDLIEKYGFKIVQVVETREQNHTELNIIDRRRLISPTNSLNKAALNTASLGLLFTIPEFKQATTWEEDKTDQDKTKQDLLNIYADIVSVPEGYEYPSEDNIFKGCFPRSIAGMQDRPVTEQFRAILERRFPNFNKYCLIFDESPLGYYPANDAFRILFLRHLNTKYQGSELINKYQNYAYADTVSGGNFTITLEQLCLDCWNKIKKDFLEGAEYFPLKVIESALTRITIIDERLYNNSSSKQHELSLKNLRILNYNLFEDRLSDVLSLAETWMSLEISGDKDKKDSSKILKNLGINLRQGLEESYCCAKHTTLIPEEITNRIIELQQQIETRIKKEASIILSKIQDYQSCSTEERSKRSFSNNIVNYINTETQSKLAHAEALHKLLQDVIEEIRKTVVSEVNTFAPGDIFCLLKGNAFRDNTDNTLFLSIHLGLIEKMLKNSEWLNDEISRRMLDKGEKVDHICNRLDSKRVNTFMEILRERFESENLQGHKELFISIHSGRGNFSKELEGALKQYPFITLSALENAFNNCKFLLCQLFYNTVYIGKGIANEIDTTKDE